VDGNQASGLGWAARLLIKKADGPVMSGEELAPTPQLRIIGFPSAAMKESKLQPLMR
jgi:hypothetical protein